MNTIFIFILLILRLGAEQQSKVA